MFFQFYIMLLKQVNKTYNIISKNYLDDIKNNFMFINFTNIKHQFYNYSYNELPKNVTELLKFDNSIYCNNNSDICPVCNIQIIPNRISYCIQSRYTNQCFSLNNTIPHESYQVYNKKIGVILNDLKTLLLQSNNVLITEHYHMYNIVNNIFIEYFNELQDYNDGINEHIYVPVDEIYDTIIEKDEDGDDNYDD